MMDFVNLMYPSTSWPITLSEVSHTPSYRYAATGDSWVIRAEISKIRLLFDELNCLESAEIRKKKTEFRLKKHQHGKIGRELQCYKWRTPNNKYRQQALCKGSVGLSKVLLSVQHYNSSMVPVWTFALLQSTNNTLNGVTVQRIL